MALRLSESNPQVTESRSGRRPDLCCKPLITCLAETCRTATKKIHRKFIIFFELAWEPDFRPSHHSQPRHHLLHPVLPDVGVNLGGGDAFVAEQGLDVHPFRPGVERVGGVIMAQFMCGNLLVNPRLLQYPPPVARAACDDTGFWPGASANANSPLDRSSSQPANPAPALAAC